MRRVFFRWRGRFDAKLRASGQTLARARVLALLAQERDGMPQRELALQFSIGNPTLVRLLDELEWQALVARGPDAGDRRASRVALTGKAPPVMAKVCGISLGLRDRVLQAIGANLDALALPAGRPGDAAS
jgi:MarR family transcriptional regulator for hemolysin